MSIVEPVHDAPKQGSEIAARCRGVSPVGALVSPRFNARAGNAFGEKESGCTAWIAASASHGPRRRHEHARPHEDQSVQGDCG